MTSHSRWIVLGVLVLPSAAAAEEILLIPGVGPRMQHESEEYRPYRAIERFRREVGNYVDEAEVARPERYVTIRSGVRMRSTGPDGRPSRQSPARLPEMLAGALTGSIAGRM